MAKPRIFISSTYYDLKHIRNSLEDFIESLGYESVLFESGDVPFHHESPIDESCYGEIQNCHMLVLIIGGRYGSPASGTQKPSDSDLEKTYTLYNSITKKEYETARDRNIPIFVFVEKDVLAEYQTYKDNRTNKTIKYHHVDSVNIYKLLDDILAQSRNNYVKDFENFDDISKWLTDQWAGLFADFLSRKSTETSLKDLSSQINKLNQVSSVLKTYTESIIRKVQPEGSEKIISRENKRLHLIKMNNFSHESMIKYLLNHGLPKTTSSKLFRALEESNSSDDFLLKTKFNKKFIEEIMTKFKDMAIRDYNSLTMRYLGNAQEVE